MRWQSDPAKQFQDLGQVVLESDPYRRLSYSWHHFQPEHAEFFDWSAEQFDKAAKERRPKVSFDLEPVGSTVKLTVIHGDFDSGSLMLEAVSGGWPEILSNRKTLLESGEPLPRADEPARHGV